MQECTHRVRLCIDGLVLGLQHTHLVSALVSLQYPSVPWYLYNIRLTI